ncbi:MAG: L,D-transpeptidase [Polyangiaceae bacterium]|jgi:hypothetical protein|nr:L,D-transpeptidase [Polyangiaceae bacterium]
MPSRPLRILPCLPRSLALPVAVLVGAVAAIACSRREPPGASASPEGASGRSATAGAAGLAPEGDDEGGDDDAGAPSGRLAGGSAPLPTGPDYEVVPGAGPKLAAKATQTWVYEGPDDETLKLGYLRSGALVDRGARPVTSTKRCKKGWYRVGPEGFVCDGRRATLDPADPIVVASWKPPRRGAPLPYLYGRSRETPPMLYVRVPSRKEQERAEGASTLGDLPPRERLVPLTGEPEPLPPFLAAGKPLPKPFGGTQRLHVGAHEGRAPARSAFAFLSVHDVDGRLFGLSTNLNLVALDRLQLARPVAIHGGELSDLPAGIVLGATPRYRLEPGAAPRRDGQYERYDVVSLSGNTREGLVETTDGFGLAAGSFKTIKKRDEWPSFAKPPARKKWIDVSVQQQQLIAYEGQRAVYIATISTGAGGLADPELTTATKRGVFTIKSKHLTATMTGAQAEDEYELADVPYVQYFEAGYALHAAYWHDEFGRARSHGCINLTPRDAAWIFEWTEPALPQGWHGVQANGAGTIVYVRP